MRDKIKIIIIILFVTFIFAIGFYSSYDRVSEKFNSTNVKKITTICTNVVDGDTIIIPNGDIVRLLGVDAPEMQESDKLFLDTERTGLDIETIKALGKEARDYTRETLEGKQIRLEFDPKNEDTNFRDEQGRLLAYVYYNAFPKLKSDYGWIMYNKGMILSGYAHTDVKYPFGKIDIFRRDERSSKENKFGLWSMVGFQRLQDRFNTGYFLWVVSITVKEVLDIIFQSIFVLLFRPFYIWVLIPAGIAFSRAFKTGNYRRYFLWTVFWLGIAFIISSTWLILCSLGGEWKIQDNMYYIYPFILFYFIALVYPFTTYLIYRKQWELSIKIHLIKNYWWVMLILIEIVVIICGFPDGPIGVRYMEWGPPIWSRFIATIVGFMIKWVIFSLVATSLMIKDMRKDL